MNSLESYFPGNESSSSYSSQMALSPEERLISEEESKQDLSNGNENIQSIINSYPEKNKELAQRIADHLEERNLPVQKKYIDVFITKFNNADLMELLGLSNTA